MESVHEEWRAVPGYEGQYEASNLGRVRSLTRTVKASNQFRECSGVRKGRVLSARKKRNGYLSVVLCGREKKVHRLVAAAFFGESSREVNHKDGDKENNRPENLEYATRGENVRHSYSEGLNTGNRGAKHGRSKLSDEQFAELVSLLKKLDE